MERQDEMAQVHIVTPLIQSLAMQDILKGHEVYLKMENCQPSGSFKIRGIGNHTQKALKRGAKHFIIASGGNAGIALAVTTRLLNVPCTVVVPTSASGPTLERLKREGADVLIHGSSYWHARQVAVKMADKPGNIYIDAYDHPEVWEGHASMIDELKLQLPCKPGVIVTAVGGGGLLCGILQGLQRAGWQDVPVVAMETIGAHCFNLSVLAKRIVPLEDITSIATCLGARTVCEETMKLLPRFNIISETVTDAVAVASCIQFADGERYLVEPACGAALAAVYSNTLSRLIKEGRLSIKGPAVVIVCGGNGVSLQLLREWSSN